MYVWTKENFHRTYEKYSDLVYRLCLLYLKNESDAKDGLQDIFLKLWEKKPSFKNEQHTQAWLIRTTKNYCLDILKGSWPEKYREVLYLYYYEEYSIREISKLNGRKESTIQSRLAAARQKLKKILEKGESDFI